MPSGHCSNKSGYRSVVGTAGELSFPLASSVDMRRSVVRCTSSVHDGSGHTIHYWVSGGSPRWGFARSTVASTHSSDRDDANRRTSEGGKGGFAFLGTKAGHIPSRATRLVMMKTRATGTSKHAMGRGTVSLGEHQEQRSMMSGESSNPRCVTGSARGRISQSDVT